MATDDLKLRELIQAIVTAPAAAAGLLTASPSLATARLIDGASRESSKEHFFDEILHYVYAGDTALHMAAAAYRTAIVRTLLSLRADVAAANRRGQQPLHYAVDGGPRAPHWNPTAQSSTVKCLIDGGADPNAVDKGGVTPLHRATRNRCSAAVAALLDGGADVHRRNGSGQTAMQLAGQTTGRGGTGLAEAKAEQAAIILLLEKHAANR